MDWEKATGSKAQPVIARGLRANHRAHAPQRGGLHAGHADPPDAGDEQRRDAQRVHRGVAHARRRRRAGEEIAEHPRERSFVGRDEEAAGADVVAATNGWLMTTDAEAYASKLWIRFIPHFGLDRLVEERLRPIPDQGMELDLGGCVLKILPAHFLHSPGNFQVYDPVAKILYSGDLGASLGTEARIVENFDARLVARILRGLVTSILSAAGVDRTVEIAFDLYVPARFGVPQDDQSLQNRSPRCPYIPSMRCSVP